MTTDRHACGLGSFLPMSCRGRAEAFARRLQSRLQSLGRTPSGDAGESEESWLTNQQHYPTSHQPRLSSSSESDIFFDFDVDFDSPGSPQEEATEADLHEILLNKSARGGEKRGECDCIAEGDSQDLESGCATASVTVTSPGSDDSSENNYFDPESFDFPPKTAPKTPLTEDLTVLIDSTLEESSSHLQCNGFQNDDEKGICVDCNASVDNSNIHEEEDKADTGMSKDCNVKGHVESQSNESKSPSIFTSEHETTVTETRNETPNTHSGYDEFDDAGYGHHTTRVRKPRVDYTKCNGLSHSHSTESHIEVEVTVRATPEEPTFEKPTPDRDEDSFCSTFSTSTHELLVECPSVVAIEDRLASLVPNVEITEPSPEVEVEVEATREVVTEVEDASLGRKLKIEDSTKVDDDDDEEERPQRVRRCSSLKTGKTPPGTPGRKKIVRFADVLGLDLADVRTFLDEIPKVPTSAYEDLQDADLSLGSSSSINSLAASIGCALPKPDKTLVPLFTQPGGCADFFDRVREQQVCLENAVVTDVVMATIAGTVRVRNLDFHKSVHIRYSVDSWRTFSDLQATYVANSCDGFSDTFSFVLYAHTLTVGQRLEFAVRFQCHGCQYWDSNKGGNYVFQCLPPAGQLPYRPGRPMSTCPDEQWASFY